MVSFSSLFSGRNKKDLFENYEKVGEWLPSKKPLFKHKLTREVVTLWDVEADIVRYKRHCGSMRTTTRGAFASQYIRIK